MRAAPPRQIRRRGASSGEFDHHAANFTAVAAADFLPARAPVHPANEAEAQPGIGAMTPERAGVQELASAIVRSAAGEAGNDAQQLDAAELLLGRLQNELVRLIGPTGFHALLDRSFQRASAQRGLAVPAGPTSAPTGHRRSFRENMQSLPARDVSGALVAVLTELLSLLTRLIGADITVGLVQRTWPGAAPWLTAAHLEDLDG